jgi:hypothetical protein
MKLARLAWAALVLCVIVVASVACSGSQKPAYDPSRDRSIPHWQDALDEIPEILVVVRPEAMRRDPTYGSFVTAAFRAAAARARATAVTRMLDAFEGSEEVVIGYRGPDDAVLVLKGVRADFDAAKLADADGSMLWHASGQRTGPQELVREERATGLQASLFVLPQRTWVIAVGQARDRARQAFTTPAARPEPKVDPQALALVRLDGPALVRAIPQLRRGSLAALGDRLSSVSVTLRPKKEGMLVTFQYPIEDPAAWAELTLKKVGEQAAEAPKLAWLKGMKVDRQGNAVTARVDLPPALLQDLPGVVNEGGL